MSPPYLQMSPDFQGRLQLSCKRCVDVCMQFCAWSVKATCNYIVANAHLQTLLLHLATSLFFYSAPGAGTTPLYLSAFKARLTTFSFFVLWTLNRRFGIRKIVIKLILRSKLLYNYAWNCSYTSRAMRKSDWC